MNTSHKDLADALSTTISQIATAYDVPASDLAREFSRASL